MPIFQEDLHDGRESPPPPKPKEYAELGTDANKQAVLDEKTQSTLTAGGISPRPGPLAILNPGFIYPSQVTSDRGELIQLLKRGASPTWLPNHTLGNHLQDRGRTFPRPPTNTPKSSPLLPPAEISETKTASQTDQPLGPGLEIERPRSALHSGDFTQEPRQRSLESRGTVAEHRIYDDHTPSWLTISPPRPTKYARLEPTCYTPDAFFRDLQARTRAPSLSSSYSSSFILKPPTTPLVQIESNDDLDLPPFKDPSPENLASDLLNKNYRRHSLQTPLRQIADTSTPSSLSSNRPLPNLRRDNTFPYQAHQPRRSLTSNPMSQHTSSPQTPPSTRPRRPSFTPDSSPSLHASMVGSYEESILRGRMSTTPSKPLDFLAQIGVLGLGNCKAALRCPAHVTIPFPAVFYSYETTTHGRPARSEDSPSPYVGQIDLENSLPNPDDVRSKRRSLVFRTRDRVEQHVDSEDGQLPSEHRIQKSERRKRRSVSPRAPPGGSYRIPEKGQLQIVIKNPNKTAVKLFLIPYDLAGMEPGTKTFIRQRSYSAGPILDSTLLPSSRIPPQNVVHRATLRYLVHLHICCPSRGRYYLFKSIRVVFANRVPDGKEKLRNEVSLPEPRFGIYKPNRDRDLGSNAGASLAAEKAFRRRSAGIALGSSNRGYVPVQPIPFTLFQRPMLGDEGLCEERPAHLLLSPDSGTSRPPTEGSDGTSMSWNSDDPVVGAYDKLRKGDAGYGGNSFPRLANGHNFGLESLLAKKLRGLDVGLPNASDQTYEEMNSM